MINKTDLMKHENLWKYIRLLNRTITSWKTDSLHYYSEIKGAKTIKYSSYKKLRKTIIEEIREFDKKSIEKPKKNRILKIENIKMMSNNGDQMGKVFKYREKILRGIYHDRVDEFEDIWNKGILQTLWKYKIIPKVKLTRYVTDEFPLILEIQKIHVVDNNNWTFSMIKDACNTICLLIDILKEFDCTLLDGHLNNVTFVNRKPIFIDIGSIIKYRVTGAKEELVFCGLFRLLFGYLGNIMLYRMPVYSSALNTAFVEPRFYNQMTRDYRYCLRKFLNFQLFHFGIAQYFDAIKMFRLYDFDLSTIDKIFPTYIKEVPNKFSDASNDDFFNSVMKCFKNKTVIDIGGGFDLIDLLIKQNCKVKKIIYLDYDEKRLDQIYLQNSNQFNDIEYYLVNYLYLERKEIEKRFNAETVVAFFPFSNSKSYQKINIKSIVNQINLMGKQNIVIVENKEHNGSEELFKELSKHYIMSIVIQNERIIGWKGKRINNASNKKN